MTDVLLSFPGGPDSKPSFCLLLVQVSLVWPCATHAVLGVIVTVHRLFCVPSAGICL